jgi:transposase
MPKYKHADVDQYQMVILNLTELFSEEHPTAQLLKILNQLDLSKFDENYHNDKGLGGASAFPPIRILAVIIWHLLYGVKSIRQLENDVKVRADLIYLSGGLTFNHSTISRFRKRHKDAIEQLFKETVFLGALSGLIDFETVCIDGSKIKACANKNDLKDREQLNKMYNTVSKICDKRYHEWESTEDEVEKTILKKKVDKLESRKEKIKAGIDFLNEHEERKRVHLNEPDCDWQKASGKGFIPGYNGQSAVDGKSKMIVSQKITTDPNDTGQTVDMVNRVEETKSEYELWHDNNKEISSNDAPENDSRSDIKTKYVMDAGYHSEKNLKELRDYDIYMPDCKLANDFKTGGAVKKVTEDDLDIKRSSNPVMIFKYDRKNDQFICVKGKILRRHREKYLGEDLYLGYKCKGCSDCDYREFCTYDKRIKELWVRKSDISTIDFKFYKRNTTKTNRTIKNSYTKHMRQKLSSKGGRSVYASRFHLSESVFAVMKYFRGGFEFFRKGFDRVSSEWTENCIAYNIGILIGFRVNNV